MWKVPRKARRKVEYSVNPACSAAFITGTSDPEADWDAYLNELSVKGVDQLLEIYQAGYDARS